MRIRFDDDSDNEQWECPLKMCKNRKIIKYNMLHIESAKCGTEINIRGIGSRSFHTNKNKNIYIAYQRTSVHNRKAIARSLACISHMQPWYSVFMRFSVFFSCFVFVCVCCNESTVTASSIKTVVSFLPLPSCKSLTRYSIKIFFYYQHERIAHPPRSLISHTHSKSIKICWSNQMLIWYILFCNTDCLHNAHWILLIGSLHRKIKRIFIIG